MSAAQYTPLTAGMSQQISQTCNIYSQISIAATKLLVTLLLCEVSSTLLAAGDGQTTAGSSQACGAPNHLEALQAALPINCQIKGGN
jgi:hypothetical protein